MAVTEQWRAVPDTEGYEVSSHGRMRRRERAIIGYIARGGYRKTKITYQGREQHVNFHRLVALAFFGACPDGMVVDHVDCDRDNNRVDNLRYITAAENVRRPFREGRGPVGNRHGRNTKPECSARGERVNTAKITEEVVREIRQLRDSGAFLHEIGDVYGIGASQVCNIVNGRSWRHVV